MSAVHARGLWNGVAPIPRAMVATGLSITLLMVTAGVAEAGEDELVLGLEPGWALLGPGPAAHGVGADASAWLGLTETLWLAASVGGVTSFAGARPHQTLGEALGGVVVALDVLRTIPFGEVLIGALASKDAIQPSVRVGLGADYFLTKTLSLGIVGRYRPLPQPLGGDGLLTVNVRLALRLEL